MSSTLLGLNAGREIRSDMKKHFDLKGQCLIAMPGMEDPRFSRAVILVCSHHSGGALGFVLNQPVLQPSFDDILEELNLQEGLAPADADRPVVPVFRGGPVEQGRGFVVHSPDYGGSSTTRVSDFACVSSTLDVLKKLASPEPPVDSIMLLGYSGWSGGQLEEEIAQNGWLTVPATAKLLFHTHHEMQYDTALSDLGISEAALSASAGHA